MPHHHDHDQCHHCNNPHSSGTIDYYWRDYHGFIPDDAIPGGKKDGEHTYIGQAYLKDVGILATQIIPGSRHVHLPINGEAVSSNVGMKILCGKEPHRFHWEEVDAKTLHETHDTKHLVIGGCEHDQNSGVGRKHHHGDTIVGKANTMNVGKAKLYFCHGDEEVGVNEYEILVYHPSCCH